MTALGGEANAATGLPDPPIPVMRGVVAADLNLLDEVLVRCVYYPANDMRSTASTHSGDPPGTVATAVVGQAHPKLNAI